MADIKNKIQKEIEKIWPDAQKNLSKINKDVTRVMQEGEKNFNIFYAQAKKKTEEIVMKAKREELYYELGKCVAPLLTSDQLKDKKVLKIYTDIEQLNKKIRSKK
jgi:hypothetical protein